jgi:hypothetical protein
MPHARLMAVVRELHQAGYQKLYLYSWPKPSGLHWRWHLFTGPRDWMQRSWREGWYGSGADYNVNPVMGWGDSPGASTEELIHALAKFDPQGLAQALGRDEDHTAWFAQCDALLPGYMYSLDMQRPDGGPLIEMPPVPVIPVRARCRRMPGRDRLAARLGRPVEQGACDAGRASISRALRQRPDGVVRIVDVGRCRRQSPPRSGTRGGSTARSYPDVAQVWRGQHGRHRKSGESAASGSEVNTSSAA